MKTENTIFQAKYRALCDNSGLTQLNADKKSLQTKVEEYKLELSRMNYQYKDIQAKYDELKLKADMNMDMRNSATAEAFAQTEPMTGATFVEQMDWNRANERAEFYKTNYQECARAHNKLRENYKALVKQNADQKAENEKTFQNLTEAYEKTKNSCKVYYEKISEYERKITKLKQNEGKMEDEMIELKKLIQTQSERQMDTDAYNQLNSKYEELKERCNETAHYLVDFKAKYEQIKKEYELSKDQSTAVITELNQLKGKYARVKEEAALFKSKYSTAKKLLEGRFGRIAYLEKKLDENKINYIPYNERKGDENIPINQ